MKKIGLIITIVGFFLNGNAQTKLDLLNFITFNSTFEKSVFEKEDTSTVLNKFLAISDNLSEKDRTLINNELNTLFSELENLGIRDKKPKKQVKIVFDYTHQKMLKKYERIVNFEEIFTNKTYNCVSASALYSIILEHFSIPFNIIEEPTHVYVITYPNTHNIILETTLPNIGFYAPKSSDIEKAVKELVKIKYVTEKEVQTKGYSKVYNEFYFSKDPISIERLASLQYYNKSIENIDDELLDLESIQKALIPIIKAQVLSPDEKNNLILYALLGQKLNLLQLDTLDDFNNVALFYSNEKNALNGSPLSYFSKSIKSELYQNGRVDFITDVYNLLKLNISDTIELNRMYYLSMARYYALSSDFEKSLEFGDKGYQFNNKDVDFHLFIKESIFSLLSQKSFDDDFGKDLELYESKYKSILNNNMRFQGYKINQNIFIVYQKLESNRFQEGLVFLDKIESDLKEIKGNPNYNRNGIAEIYAMYCAYFYRKGQISKSKIFLERGLKHSKNNAALIRKKDILK